MTQAFCTVALITLAACAQAQTAEPQPRIVTRRRHGHPSDDG